MMSWFESQRLIGLGSWLWSQRSDFGGSVGGERGQCASCCRGGNRGRLLSLCRSVFMVSMM